MPRDPMTLALLGVAGLFLLAGLGLTIVLWILYRRSDVPLYVVFISPLFVASPDYFRAEGQALRRWTARCFALGFACLIILYKLKRPKVT